MNKKIICSAAALAVVAFCGTSASAAARYTADDALHLRNAIMCSESFTASDDINGDGSVDVFDLCCLRRELLSKGEFTEQSFPITDNYVKTTGRTYSDSSAEWLIQSGSSVEFTVSGKSAEIILKGYYGIDNDENYRPRYAVLVDDEVILDATMGESEKTIVLFSGNTSRTAKVKVILLSESMYGAVGVSEITVNSDSAVPVIPTKENDLCIEFIGDSITCAYGVEGASSSESFKTTTENFMKSYAYLTAKKLNADYSTVCYSGHGIVSGYTSSGEKNSESLIPECYTLIGKSDAYASEWDFSSRKNDVVVINLGTNDTNYVQASPDTRSQEFIDGYIDFLGTIREKNPEAYIICTLGTMGGEDIYLLVEEAVNSYKSTSGDERIMCYQSATQNVADGLGSDWHPSAVTQQNSAYVLADKICQALGIESDQIGLDVAADASYELALDSEKGGNAASYFSDYDKSFWINMVTGGSSPDAVEAVISGIELKKDGIYRLEFDYTTTEGEEVPVLIRSSSDRLKEYFSDSVTGTGEKTHFSAELTAPEADDNISISFQLGGTDYYSFTIYNLRLVKIG